MAINAEANQESSTLPEDAMQRRAQAKLQNLVAELRISPLTIDDLRKMGDLWPEEQGVDDFISAVRQWRTEGVHERTIP